MPVPDRDNYLSGLVACMQTCAPVPRSQPELNGSGSASTVDPEIPAEIRTATVIHAAGDPAFRPNFSIWQGLLKPAFVVRPSFGPCSSTSRPRGLPKDRLATLLWNDLEFPTGRASPEAPGPSGMPGRPTPAMPPQLVKAAHRAPCCAGLATRRLRARATGLCIWASSRQVSFCLVLESP